MRQTGMQTQQGYLRMRSVHSVEISHDERYDAFLYSFFCT